MIKNKKALEEYIDFYERITPRNLHRIDSCVSPNIHFHDPLNDVHGMDRYHEVLMQMFRHWHKVNFKINDFGWGRDEDHAFMAWVCNVTPRKGKSFSFTGMSYLTFDSDNKIMDHVCHWDTGSTLYARTPVLGSIIKFIKKKIVV